MMGHSFDKRKRFKMGGLCDYSLRKDNHVQSLESLFPWGLL